MEISNDFKTEKNVHVTAILIVIEIMGCCKYWEKDTIKKILDNYEIARMATVILCKGSKLIAHDKWIKEKEIMIDFTHAYKSIHEDEYYLKKGVVSKWFSSTIKEKSLL